MARRDAIPRLPTHSTVDAIADGGTRVLHRFRYEYPKRDYERPSAIIAVTQLDDRAPEVTSLGRVPRSLPFKSIDLSIGPVNGFVERFIQRFVQRIFQERSIVLSIVFGRSCLKELELNSSSRTCLIRTFGAPETGRGSMLSPESAGSRASQNRGGS